MPSNHKVSTVERGDPRGAEQLLNLAYEDLRRLAAYKMAQETPNQTLQPTALVHEAWLKLVGAGERKFENRADFFSVASEAMRQILIDRARLRRMQCYGGQCQHVQLEETGLAAPTEDDQLLVVDEALEGLSQEHPVQAQVVKLRYYGGMTDEEIAQAMGLFVPTVKNYWTFARAWLFDAIHNR